MSAENKFVIETERLGLRETTAADAQKAYELNLDHEVLQYTGDVPFNSVDDARSFLESYDHFKKYGFGRWAVIRKSDGEWLGWCGLKYSLDHNEYDIGFRFFKKYWNQGYATEAATACILYGFEKFGMSTIVGRVMKENTASIKVLEKCGLSFIGEIGYSHDCDWMYGLSLTSG